LSVGIYGPLKDGRKQSGLALSLSRQSSTAAGSRLNVLKNLDDLSKYSSKFPDIKPFFLIKSYNIRWNVSWFYFTYYI